VSTTIGTAGGPLREIGLHPGQLLVADARARVRHVVDRDEVHALVVERIVGFAEEFLVRGAAVQGRIVFARHEAHLLDLQGRDDVAELRHPAAPLDGIVGGVREVAGEDDEFRLLRQRVDAGDRLPQRVGGVRIRGTREAPVGVRQLHEEEVLVGGGGRRAGGGCASDQARRVHGAPSEGKQFQQSRRFVMSFLQGGGGGSLGPGDEQQVGDDVRALLRVRNRDGHPLAGDERFGIREPAQQAAPVPHHSGLLEGRGIVVTGAVPARRPIRFLCVGPTPLNWSEWHAAQRAA
jgi:hypothetical protein